MIEIAFLMLVILSVWLTVENAKAYRENQRLREELAGSRRYSIDVARAFQLAARQTRAEAIRKNARPKLRVVK